MGQQQSKDELLYRHAVDGNVEAINALRTEGAGLEWVDRDGKTPLMTACLSSERSVTARTLVELGADVNAYRPGRNAGTPLHHAASRGLDYTVQLLLCHGANALIKNDDSQTPLEVARAKGFSDVVHTIESHICIFSGWVRELYGPGFLEVLAPKLLSKKIWVVVVPHDSTMPLKLELAVYSSLQDGQPRTVISLWNANVEEPNFQQPDPAVIISDKSTKSQYKFASASHGDKNQIHFLYKACIGSVQVTHPSTANNFQTGVLASAAETAAEAMELARAIHASIQSSTETREPLPPPIDHNSVANNPTDWNFTNDTIHNGWGSLVGPTASGTSTQGWGDEPSEVQDNEWGNGVDRSNHHGKDSNQKPISSRLISNGWMDEPSIEKYNGWGISGPNPLSIDVQAEVQCNGWESASENLTQNPRGTTSRTTSSHVCSSEKTDKLTKENSRSPGNNQLKNSQLEANFAVPSAPPAPEEVYNERSVLYPTIDLTQVGPPSTTVDELECSLKPDKQEDSPMCIICWESPVEGACIPCGHMVGCMSCSNEIKSKKGDCPVCRQKIDQVIKLYAV